MHCIWCEGKPPACPLPTSQDIHISYHNWASECQIFLFKEIEERNILIISSFWMQLLEQMIMTFHFCSCHLLCSNQNIFYATIFLDIVDNPYDDIYQHRCLINTTHKSIIIFLCNMAIEINSSSIFLCSQGSCWSRSTNIG